MTAPSCPISNGQPIPGAQVFHKGTPWTRPGTLQDLINSIPQAHDLKSAIAALHRINSVIQQINHGQPVVNNTHQPSEPDTIVKGEDLNPHYLHADWIQESREYNTQRVYNPDNEAQYIEIKTLKTVHFYNQNTDYRLNYSSAPGA
jgi:hypothetical protein